MILVCAWCDKVNIDGNWIKLTPDMDIVVDVVTHGICEACFNNQITLLKYEITQNSIS